jgi:asparagine N-glycosylation enzyme membrane subunit Stt3
MPSKTLVNNALTLRRAIGSLGLALPFVLVIGNLIFSSCKWVQNSLSMYYFTFMGDAFVGILVAISVFFYNYRGYDSKDLWAGKLACFFGCLVAFFPPYLLAENLPCTKLPYKQNPIFGYIHTGAAVAFFIILAVYCLFLFTQGHKNQAPTPQKTQRNLLYKICGWVIIAMLLLMFSMYIWPNWAQILAPVKPLLLFEAIVLWAFGVAWLTKGKMWLKDLGDNDI